MKGNYCSFSGVQLIAPILVSYLSSSKLVLSALETFNLSWFADALNSSCWGESSIISGFGSLVVSLLFFQFLWQNNSLRSLHTTSHMQRCLLSFSFSSSQLWLFFPPWNSGIRSALWEGICLMPDCLHILYLSSPSVSKLKLSAYLIFNEKCIFWWALGKGEADVPLGIQCRKNCSLGTCWMMRSKVASWCFQGHLAKTLLLFVMVWFSTALSLEHK